MEELFLADARFQASLAAFNLRSMDVDNYKNIRAAYEIDLNANLSRHYDYLGSNWKWLWPELRAKDDQPILNAVNYRINHEYADPILSNPENHDSESEFMQALIAESKVMERKRKSVISRYREQATDPNLEIYAGDTYNK